MLVSDMTKSIPHKVRSYRVAIIRLHQRAPTAAFLIALRPSQKITNKFMERWPSG
jgi:hypothetical protein